MLGAPNMQDAAQLSARLLVVMPDRPVAFEASLDPPASSGTRRGAHTLRVHNATDEAMRVDVSAFDPSLAVEFVIEPPDFSVVPGGEGVAHLAVRANRRAFLGRRRDVPFIVAVHPEHGRPVTVEGVFKQRRSVVALLLSVVLLAGAIGGGIFLVARGDEDDASDDIVIVDEPERGTATTPAPLPTAPEVPGTTTTTALTATRPVRNLIAYAVVRNGVSNVEVVRSDGSERFAVTAGSGAFEPAWSPDKQRLAFTTCPQVCAGLEADFEIFVREENGDVRNITNNPSRDGGASWSPDGARIAFHSNRSGTHEIWTMNADGTDPKQVTTLESRSVSPAWSPDGTRLAFTSDRGGNIDVYVLNLLDGSVTNLTAAAGADSNASWSPDGRSIAFDSDRLGTLDIYVVDAAGGIPRRVTTALAGESDPAWSPDGSQLLFVSNAGGNPDLMTIPATGGEAKPLSTDPAPETNPDWG